MFYMRYVDKAKRSLIFFAFNSFFCHGDDKSDRLISIMTEVNSKFQYQTAETVPVYVNPDQMFGTNNVRLRHIKSNIPIEPIIQPAHFILSTGDYPLNERENDPDFDLRNRHNITQIIYLIFTALAYLLYTLRAYIPEDIQTLSYFWLSIKLKPIARVYTSDLRPSLFIENFLLRFAEICQTLWLVYILSYIPRRTDFGYLYRNPEIFNTLIGFLLISALSLQAISQTSLPPEIVCSCLFISFILLIIICRLIAMKLVKYEEKIKSTELIIIRYFVLNSLFLYTTSIGYLTICSSVECIAFHIDSNVTLSTTIGLSIVLILLFIYFLFDQLIYENEFRSIWTPYLFIGIAFICPPLRQLNLITDDVNFYLLWALFSTTLLMILIRICRQIFLQYRAMKLKSYIPQVTSDTKL